MRQASERLIVMTLAGMTMLSGACGAPPQAVPSSPPVLTPVAFAPQNLADYSPGIPYRQLVPGLMARTVYVADASGSNRIQIWELLSGPGQKTGTFSLPGAAVLSISSGRGVITVNGRTQEVNTGQVVTVDEGAELLVENRTDGAGLMIRATLITRAGR